MDSVTQLVLGAAVGEAAIGRKVGNRAVLWGAVAGTLPDLDVFVPLGDAVKNFTYHRSASHSLIVLAALTPLLAWLITRIHSDMRSLFRRWMLMLYLVFATHVLLDSLTAYGTQIFWPLSSFPVAISSIFIIDPAYTTPLVIGVICALMMTRDSNRGHLINRVGLILSSIYLGWTLIAKVTVESSFRNALAEQDIPHKRIFTTPAPFNTLLWRAVIMRENGYYEAYYSLFDSDHKIRFQPYTSHDEVLNDIADHWPIKRLRWFSHGFYSVTENAGDIVINDLRMGVEPHYVFRFKVAEAGNPHPQPVAPVHLPPVRRYDLLPSVWARIWNPHVRLDQEPGTTPK